MRTSNSSNNTLNEYISSNQIHDYGFNIKFLDYKEIKNNNNLFILYSFKVTYTCYIFSLSNKNPFQELSWIIERNTDCIQKLLNNYKYNNFKNFELNIEKFNYKQSRDQYMIERILTSILRYNENINCFEILEFFDILNNIPEFNIINLHVKLSRKAYTKDSISKYAEFDLNLEEYEVVDICSLEKLIIVGVNLKNINSGIINSLSNQVESYLSEFKTNFYNSYFSNKKITTNSNYKDSTNEENKPVSSFFLIYGISNGCFNLMYCYPIKDKNISKLLLSTYIQDVHLITGYSNGFISFHKLLANYKGDIKLEQLAYYKVHSNKITSLYFNYFIGYVYSMSDNSNKVVVSEVNYQSIIYKFELSKYNIEYINYAVENEYIICIDSENTLWYFNIYNHMNIKIKGAVHKLYSTLNSIFYSNDNDDYNKSSINNNSNKFKYDCNNRVSKESNKSSINSTNISYALNNNNNNYIESETSYMDLDKEHRLLILANDELDIYIIYIYDDYNQVESYGIEFEILHKINVIKNNDLLKVTNIHFSINKSNSLSKLNYLIVSLNNGKTYIYKYDNNCPDVVFNQNITGENILFSKLYYNEFNSINISIFNKDNKHQKSCNIEFSKLINEKINNYIDFYSEKFSCNIESFNNSLLYIGISREGYILSMIIPNILLSDLLSNFIEDKHKCSFIKEVPEKLSNIHLLLKGFNSDNSLKEKESIIRNNSKDINYNKEIKNKTNNIPFEAAAKSIINEKHTTNNSINIYKLDKIDSDDDLNGWDEEFGIEEYKEYLNNKYKSIEEV